MKKKGYRLGAILLVAIIVGSLTNSMPRAYAKIAPEIVIQGNDKISIRYIDESTKQVEDDKRDTVTMAGSNGITFTKDGNLLIANMDKNFIAQYNADGIKIAAGKVMEYNDDKETLSYQDGALNTADFYTPYDVLPYQDGYVVSDRDHHVIRYVVDGKVTTLAGNGNAGYLDGNHAKAEFESPTGMALDSKGNLYVSDTYNNVIRKISPKGKVTTFAGSGDGYADGSVKEAKFHEPVGLYYYKDTLYVVDSGNQRIRTIKNGIVSTLAGGYKQEADETFGGYVGSLKNGSLKYAQFNNPQDIVVASDGTIYVTDHENSRIRKIKGKRVSDFYVSDGSTLISPSSLCIEKDWLYCSDDFTGDVYRFQIKN